MPNTSSTSQVKAKPPAYQKGDHVIYPAHGLYTITDVETINVSGIGDVSTFVLAPFGQNSSDQTNRIIRIPQARIAREVTPLPTAEKILEAEKILGRRYAQGPGHTAGGMKVYNLINSWDFLKMAEGVAKLRPCIKIYPPSSESALPAINTAIDRLALITSLVTGEDRAAAVTRLVTLSDAAPAPNPSRPPAKNAAKDAKAVAADGVPADAPPSV